MKFKKSYLILGSLLSASVIPMVAMSCATTKTDDKKPMEVKDKPGISTTPTTSTPDKQGTNTPATTPTDKSGTTDTSNQSGKTETPASGTSGTGKAEGDSAGKSGADAEATPGSAGTGTGQDGSADTAMSS